jgi:hypothetical protein
MLSRTKRAACAAAFAAVAFGLSAQEDGVRLAAELDLSFQYRYRSADVLIEDSTYNNGIDFQRNYLSSPPLASGSLDIGGPQGLSAGFGAELRREFTSSYKQGYFNATNFPLLGRDRNPIAVEKGAITRGALYWKSPSFDISLGRDKVDYGKELEGTLYPSLRLPYLDAFRSQARLGPFTLDWMVATMDAAESYDGNDVDPNWTVTSNSNVQDSTGQYSLEDKAYGFEGDENPTTILEALHRISWNFGTVRLGAAENYLVARRNNRIVIQDILPLVSWHQASVMPNNNTLLFDLTWDPTPELELSGVGGFDDINANMFGVGDSDVPTIGAYVVGGRYKPEDVSAKPFDAYFEAGYTHYLWGNFSANKQGDITDVDPLARAIYRLRLNTGGVLIPLTSPYGPGARWLRLEGGYRLGLTGPRLGAELLLLGKNSEANLVSTLYDQSAKDGAEFFFGSLTLPISWKLGAFELEVAPAALLRNQRWWAEATFTASYSYKAETFLKRPGS